MNALDKVDIKILELLQKNARMTLKEIASQVYLTSPAVSARIDKLERCGVIEGYHARINPEAVCLPVKAFVNVKVKQDRKRDLYRFVKQTENVIRCDCVTGDYLIFLEVLFHDTDELDRFIETLGRFGETRTQIVYSTALEERILPVWDDKAAV